MPEQERQITAREGASRKVSFVTPLPRKRAHSHQEDFPPHVLRLLDPRGCAGKAEPDPQLQGRRGVGEKDTLEKACGQLVFGNDGKPRTSKCIFMLLRDLMLER